jgi:hypothetical protein
MGSGALFMYDRALCICLGLGGYGVGKVGDVPINLARSACYVVGVAWHI